MSKYTLALVLASATLATGAFGQAKPQEPSTSQPVPKSQGVKIEGNTNIQAQNVSVHGFARHPIALQKNVAIGVKRGDRIEAKKKESGPATGTSSVK